MRPAAVHEQPGARSGGRLEGRVALITGGDSGIGRATAYAFAREGADVMIVYLEEDEDARDTAARVKELGQRCEIHRADVGDEAACREAVAATMECFGRLDILVNNAAGQHPQESILDIAESQRKTSRASGPTRRSDVRASRGNARAASFSSRPRNPPT